MNKKSWLTSEWNSVKRWTAPEWGEFTISLLLLMVSAAFIWVGLR